jgi:hypothetical protein
MEKNDRGRRRRTVKETGILLITREELEAVDELQISLEDKIRTGSGEMKTYVHSEDASDQRAEPDADAKKAELEIQYEQGVPRS